MKARLHRVLIQDRTLIANPKLAGLPPKYVFLEDIFPKDSGDRFWPEHQHHLDKQS